MERFRLYRMAPELRRSAVYVLVALPLLAPVAFWVALFAQQRSILEATLICSFLVALGMGMFLPLRWAVRVDDQGVARRWLIRWDLWSWDDFASGRIEKRHPFTFVDPLRPWWRRRLRLDYLDGVERMEVSDLINGRYRLPPSPPRRECLQIPYGFRRSVRLDWRGVHLLTRGTPHEYLWSDVRRVHIVRMDPLRRDFTVLELFLPDHEIELKLLPQQGTTNPSWRGATAEEINDFLLALIPPDRVDIDIHGARPRKAIDVERFIAQAQQNDRCLRVCLGVSLSLLIVVVIWMALHNVLQSLAMLALCAIFCPVVWFVHRESQGRIRKWETWLAELHAAEANELPEPSR
jgi:hypothetical protein